MHLLRFNLPTTLHIRKKITVCNVEIGILGDF